MEAEDAAAVRARLLETARQGSLISYRELGAAAGIEPPGMIRRVAAALETSMEADAREGRPLLAALCVQKGGAVPRAGFFVKARELGLYAGPETGPEAAAWHAAELERAWAFYR